MSLLLKLLCADHCKSLTSACSRWYLRKSKHSWRQCWGLFWNHRSHKWDYRILRRKNLSWVFALNHNPYKEKIELDFVHEFFFFLWILSSIYAACPKKKSHTRKFRWTAFSFDYGMHSPWHHFDKLLQCHYIYSHPVALIFRQDLVLVMGESDRCAKSSPAHPKDSQWG